MQEPIGIHGDFTPIRVNFGDEPHVVCAGDAGGGVARLAVNGHDCALERGRWVSPPLPYWPGMEVTVRFIDGKGKGTEVRATLPGPDELGPVFGPGWTTYAPLS